ncbi:cytochrome-c peroxidase [Methylobacterium oxalidis]|uniref:Methylamine utilization protein MauG n=2 Tax=Methylobacterium oxalidis TaxID=944322 RepID=A0A512IZA6_9HYPH|nr:cytochrome-c peroxidase [Methylobacterium oxalidis]GJE31681.1 Cytochrome c551 peroxidase [Methylobacterium oxalidis]GLS65974.1 cytochrome-c peroxidase [Methylobacterium oxalidis]
MENGVVRRRRRLTASLLLVAAVSLAATAGSLARIAGVETGGLAGSPAIELLKARFRRPDAVPFPKANPHSPGKEDLGRTLFFDPRLSRSGSVSCASCHNPSLGWSDGLARAVGFEMKPLARRTPPIMNLAWGSAFQWDGRAESLEHQARMPLTAPDEMNMTMEMVIERLVAIPGYRALFAQAFERPDAITAESVTAALATYQRTLVSGRAPFDRWVAGEESALGPDAKRGFALFTGKARCASCHSTWRLTDDSFHDIGLTGDDPGRGTFAPPSVVTMQRAFKTPSLRDLRLQGPYMHDGSVRTLDDVIEHYVKGGAKRPSLSPEMRPIALSADERHDLIAFLSSLKAEPIRVELPQLP